MSAPQSINDAALVVFIALAVVAMRYIGHILALAILVFAGLVARIVGVGLVAPLHQHGRDGE